MSPFQTTDRGELSPEEIRRYGRHLTLPDVGIDGQRRIKQARVLVVGAGGLGSPIALYLAAAGVGTIGLADFDRVDETNLQRQILFGGADVGQLKTDAARSRLEDLNPNVRVEAIEGRLTSENALEIIRGFDIVVDGTDNFPTRYLVNDACVLTGTPNVYGSIFRFEGQASVFGMPDGPCYRCLFREPPPPGLVPSCAEAGVLGVLPGIIGSIQATEALKLILGIGETLSGRLLLVDALHMRMRDIAVRRDPSCPACGTREITALIDYEEFCGMRAQPSEEKRDITPKELADVLRRGDPIALIDVREPFEHQIARIDGATLIPLRSLERSLDTLDPARETVVFCHHGTRSARAAEFMRERGFTRVLNLTGGIDRWSTEVDPAVRKY